MMKQATSKRQLQRADVAPIIEGKLYSWGMMRLEYPGADISSYGKREGRNETFDTTSPQEQWATKHAQELRDAAVIESTWKRLDETYQRLLYMRYVQRERWTVIARALNYSYSHVLRERDRLIAVMAFAFGLMDKNEEEESKCG